MGYVDYKCNTITIGITINGFATRGYIQSMLSLWLLHTHDSVGLERKTSYDFK